MRSVEQLREVAERADPRADGVEVCDVITVVVVGRRMNDG
jgi:hypothetical protein